MELKMEGLTKHYGSKVALDHLSFTMTKGVYGLLGPNGAGKSTMMNILAGNLRPTSGRVYWNGTDVQELGKEYRALLGFMPQQQALYPEFRGREFLYYMAALEQMPRGLVQKRVETVRRGRPHPDVFRGHEAAAAAGSGNSGRTKAADLG